MIYILKFIAAFLLPPGLFVLLGIILSVYLWRRRQNFGRFAFSLSAVLTLLLYFSSTLLGAKLLGQPLENRYSQQEPAAAQVIIVLGGGSVGSVPDGAERGGLMSAGAARLLTAARLAKQHSLPVLISGGQVFSDGASEALVAERILLQLGLPQEQIIVETQARTTQENAAYTAALCRERGYHNVLLLTSALHMPRSMQFFERYLLRLPPIPVIIRSIRRVSLIRAGWCHSCRPLMLPVWLCTNMLVWPVPFYSTDLQRQAASSR